MDHRFNGRQNDPADGSMAAPLAGSQRAGMTEPFAAGTGHGQGVVPSPPHRSGGAGPERTKARGTWVPRASGHPPTKRIRP